MDENQKKNFLEIQDIMIKEKGRKSDSDLAKEAKTTQPHISKIFSKNPPNITFATLYNVLDWLGLKLKAVKKEDDE